MSSASATESKHNTPTRRQQLRHSPSLPCPTSVLYLKQSHVRFEAPDNRYSVFFDECNRDIISLRTTQNSKTRVSFQATERDDKVDFELAIEKRILSIKFNADRSILAYYVEKSNIEFVNVKKFRDAVDGHSVYTLDDKRYIQSSKTKDSKLLGFLWTGLNEVVIITDISVEYYSIDPAKRRLKHLKSFQSSTNWFVYQPRLQAHSSDGNDFSVLMVSTGSIGHSIQPYLFIRNQIIKLERFLVEGDWHGDKLELFEQSITICNIYGFVRLLVLQHESLNVRSKGSQIVIYTTDHVTRITTKTHTLNLDTSGRLAVNILENLVIAHDQPSKKSFIFDIMLESTEKSDCPDHFVSVFPGQTVRSSLNPEENRRIDMYSVFWVFFQPNFIIDVKQGVLSTLHLDMDTIADNIQDNRLFLSFLSFRQNSEKVILTKCKNIVNGCLRLIHETYTSPSITPLADVSATFEILGSMIESYGNITTEGDKSSTTDTGHCKRHIRASISQKDLHHEVFQQLELGNYDSPQELHFVVSVMQEFILIVRSQNRSIDFVIYKSLIGYLVKYRLFYHLIQMLRSEVIEDSKELACYLLCLRSHWRPAAQLGIDMLHRLDCLSGLLDSLNVESGSRPSQCNLTNKLSAALQQSIDIASRDA